MKKICALMVYMTVCGAALFAQAPATDFDTKAEGAPNGGGVVITKYKGKSRDVVIPAAIGGKAVVGIGAGAFSWYDSLSTVTIPAGVTVIGESAFAGCTGLSTVTIPAGVTTIGEWAFFNCTGLSTVTIPAGVTTIGEGTFSDCYSLTTVTIPSSVTAISRWAFFMCHKLKPEVRADIEKRLGKDVF